MPPQGGNPPGEHIYKPMKKKTQEKIIIKYPWIDPHNAKDTVRCTALFCGLLTLRILGIDISLAEAFPSWLPSLIWSVIYWFIFAGSALAAYLFFSSLLSYLFRRVCITPQYIKSYAWFFYLGPIPWDQVSKILIEEFSEDTIACLIRITLKPRCRIKRRILGISIPLKRKWEFNLFEKPRYSLIGGYPLWPFPTEKRTKVAQFLAKIAKEYNILLIGDVSPGDL